MSLRQVHHALIRSLSLNPQTANFNSQELDRHADVINNRVRFGYEAEFWPLEMDVLEVSFDPGELRIVLFDEYGIGMVDRNQCAYRDNPSFADTPPISGVKWVKGGIILPASAPAVVYLKFRPPTPRFSLQPWDKDVAYFEGDLAYVQNEGDCYRALIQNEDQRPAESPVQWERVVFPEFLFNYVRYGCHADMISEDLNKQQSTVSAENEMERLRDLFVEQSGSGRRISYSR